ncbi:MAG: prepilin-type N-terminal cleavage/methylation domain-containing protein [Actinomycetota bacterium]|nr:prepilin-type N-terminal cleavage/methylation domain-containing protein [Actinomycetota bacterium]
MSRLATRDERGFTLIELLVVVVVIGVLAVVVVLNLGGVASQATASACRSDVNTVETAIGAYHTEAGDTSPASIALLTGGANPYLQSWPSSLAYTLTLSAGTLYVQTPIDSSPVLASDANACAGAASGTSTTTVVVLAPIGTDASSIGTNTGTLVGGGDREWHRSLLWCRVIVAARNE